MNHTEAEKLIRDIVKWWYKKPLHIRRNNKDKVLLSLLQQADTLAHQPDTTKKKSLHPVKGMTCFKSSALSGKKTGQPWSFEKHPEGLVWIRRSQEAHKVLLVTGWLCGVVHIEDRAVGYRTLAADYEWNCNGKWIPCTN